MTATLLPGQVRSSLEDCGNQALHEKKLSESPEYQQAHEEFEAKILQSLQNPEFRGITADSYTLPVVVHIIHQNGAENISNTQVLNGIEYLNEAYANRDYYDRGTGVDTEISFCLAARTPAGQPTNGINRVVSPLTDLNMDTEDRAMKNLSRWDPTRYINIWLVKRICSDNGSCSVAGYAYLPSAHGKAYDGIVMESYLLGSSKAKTSVLHHEMGHYLGLYHTFQSGCPNNDCALDGDRVCDTPPDASTAPVPCQSSVNSCSTDTDSGFPVDQDDHFWNYMDYGSLDCYSEFTDGQKTRMHASIQGVRSSLLDSRACENPCNNVVTAFFDMPSDEIAVGGTLSFDNTSVNASTYIWEIDGVEFSTDVNATYTFNELGSFVISLTARSSSSDCTDDLYRDTVQVYCPVEADFTMSSSQVLPGESVSFQNESKNASSYSWSVNGNIQSSGSDYSFIPGVEGIYKICLEASNTHCTDQTCQYLVASTESDSCETEGFYKSLGGENTDEYGKCVIPLNDGTILIGASKEDKTLLINTTINGTILWTKELDFIEGGDVLFVMNLDDEGYLFGAGRNSNATKTFYFKFDLNSKQVKWNKNTNGIIICNMIQNTHNSNYILSLVDKTTINILLVEVDKNTGERSGNINKNYNLTSSETNLGLVSYKNNFYATGRYSYTGSSIGLMRVGLTKYDMRMNEVYSVVAHLPSSKTARMYSTCIKIYKDEIYVIAQGDVGGTSLNNQKVFLYKFSLGGDLHWVKSYSIDHDSKNATTEFLINERGFLIKGLHNLSKKNKFLLQVDFSGNPLWCKSYRNTSSNPYGAIINNTLFTVGNHIYIVDVEKTNGNANIAFLKTDLNGDVDGDCNFIEEVPVQTSSITNAQAYEVDLNAENPAFSSFDKSVSVEEGGILSKDICKITCVEICNNGIDDDFDGLIDCEDNLDCPLPDLFIKNMSYDCAEGQTLVTVEVCNIDSIAIGPEIPISLYSGNPTVNMDAELLDTIFLDTILEADQCVELTFEGLQVKEQYFIHLNNDGSHPAPVELDSIDIDKHLRECDYSNNLSSIFIEYEEKELDLGEDVTVCENGLIHLSVSEQWYEVKWSDASTGRLYSSHRPGKHWAVVKDECGVEYSDTVSLLIDPATVLNLGRDTSICLGDSLTIGSDNFSSYQWSPANVVPCTDCDSITVAPDSSTVYTLVVSDDNGCYSVDSIRVDLAEDTIFNTWERQICQGDSIIIFDEYRSVDSTYFSINDSSSCVIIDSVRLQVLDTFDILEERQICMGDSSEVFGNWVKESGVYKEEYLSSEDCDSTYTIALTVMDTFLTTERRTICRGDSTEIFETYEWEEGLYHKTFQASNSCDSTHRVHLTYLPDLEYEAFAIPTCQGEDNGGIWLEISGGSPPYNYQWSHSSASDSALQNLATGMYAFTITDSEYCSISDSIYVDSLTIEIADILSQDLSCYGADDGWIEILTAQEELEFSLDSNGQYSAINTYKNLPAGGYNISVRNGAYCMETFPVTITSPEPLRLWLPEDITLEYGDSVRVLAKTEGDYDSLFWSPPEGLDCEDCIDVMASPGYTTEYFLTLIDSNDCRALDSMTIFVEYNKNIYVPNAFSPNGDGVNDLFRIYTGQAVVEVLSFEIYDRWGSRVYESRNFSTHSRPAVGWSGTFKNQDCNQGAYVWKAQFRMATGEEPIYSGSVLLLR